MSTGRVQDSPSSSDHDINDSKTWSGFEPQSMRRFTRYQYLTYDTYDFRQAVWSALMISSATNTKMILGESGPFLSLLFIVTTPCGNYVTLSKFSSHTWFDLGVTTKMLPL